jgi:hypothetical protein
MPQLWQRWFGSQVTQAPIRSTLAYKLYYSSHCA